jgi:hypothetical protein
MSLYGADPVSFESVSAVTATPSTELGQVRMFAGELYEYVYAVKEIPVGYGCVKTGTSGHSVAATGSVSGEMAAGFCKHAAISSGSYGWVLKKGVVDLKNGRAGTAPSVNQVVRLGADGAVVCDLMVATSAIDHGFIAGKVLSAGASGDTGASLALCYVSVF